MSRKIIFISDSIFTSETKLSLTDLINDQGQRALYVLRKLLKKKDENIAYLWQQLQDIEKQFFHLSESTISNPVHDSISYFCKEAMKDEHIDHTIIENIYKTNSDVEIINILDTIEDDYINGFYHRIIQKKKLYESFYSEYYLLSKNIADAIDFSKKTIKKNRIGSKEAMLLKCFSKDCNMKSVVKIAARYDTTICILSEDDLDMRQAFIKRFPEMQNVIVVPNKLLHNYCKDSIGLYITICSQLDGYDCFYLIDDNEANIEAAKCAGWNTTLFDSSDYKKNNTFKDRIKLEQKLVQEVKKIASENKEKNKLYTRVL